MVPNLLSVQRKYDSRPYSSYDKERSGPTQRPGTSSKPALQAFRVDPRRASSVNCKVRTALAAMGDCPLPDSRVNHRVNCGRARDPVITRELRGACGVFGV